MDDNIKVMYVDDEVMNLQLFKLNFNKKYEIITAESGVSALNLLEKHMDTEIVISDMKMPVMTGLEFIQKAKSKYPNIKFYILTGYDITYEIQEALNTKLILKYFRKPFDFNAIDTAIRTALS
jgi:two-component system, response regulator, stage 0 sporulation protein F